MDSRPDEVAGYHARQRENALQNRQHDAEQGDGIPMPPEGETPPVATPEETEAASGASLLARLRRLLGLG